MHAPPFRALMPEEDDEVVRMINEAGPDIVWVGLGCPKQERWMAEHIDRLHAPALIGVGAAFDFHAGLKKQAPRWMQRHGMEILFRVLSEPRHGWGDDSFEIIRGLSCWPYWNSSACAGPDRLTTATEIYPDRETGHWQESS